MKPHHAINSHDHLGETWMLFLSQPPAAHRASHKALQAVTEFLSPGLCMTGLQETQETRATILLRCEELQSYLDVTKKRLNQAASQLEELTKILLSQSSASRELLARPWLNELAIGQLVDDVVEAERKLLAVRTVAAGLGIPLPVDLK